MLRDRIRNEAFRAALTHAVKPGDVVLDVGAGSGILSMFAAAAGAARVYAVERTRTAELAKALIAKNGFADRITVITSDLEDVTLPEKVDVIVSEWMGGLGVDENMLAPVVIARDRWLKPGGKMIPAAVTALAAPVELVELDTALAYWHSRPHGLDLGEIGERSAHEMLSSQSPIEADEVLATPVELWSHTVGTVTLAEADQSFVGHAKFTARRAGHVSAFAGWFVADMGDGKVLSTAPDQPFTHWGRRLFPLSRPAAIEAGTPISFELRCEPTVPGSCEQAWTVEIGNRATDGPGLSAAVSAERQRGVVEQHDTREHMRSRYSTGSAQQRNPVE